MSDDRPRLSWREIDQRRSGGRTGSEEPRGPKERESQARASTDALKQADSIFSLGKGGSTGSALAKQMREAFGTGAFVSTCRAYADEVGVPDDPALLCLWLDTQQDDLVTAALEALLTLQNAGSLQLAAGLKSQLRLLEQHRDDAIAGISEELLEG